MLIIDVTPRELRRGLDVRDKPRRVCQYARIADRKLGVIAHPYGVDAPRMAEAHTA